MSPTELIKCGSKVRHPSRREAARAARQHRVAADLRGNDRHPMNVYACEFCGGFHVGNSDPDRNRARAQARGRAARRVVVVTDDN